MANLHPRDGAAKGFRVPVDYSCTFLALRGGASVNRFKLPHKTAVSEGEKGQRSVANSGTMLTGSRLSGRFRAVLFAIFIVWEFSPGKRSNL